MMPCRDRVLPAIQRNWEMPRLLPVLGAVAGCLNHAPRAAMVLFVAVLAASLVTKPLNRQMISTESRM